MLFLDVPLAGALSSAKSQTSEQLPMLVAHARQWARLAAQFPALASTVKHAEPGTVTRYPMFTVTLAESEDAFAITCAGPPDSVMVADVTGLYSPEVKTSSSDLR